MEQITLEQINEYRKKYRNNENNKILENAITNKGIQDICLNREAVLRAKNTFNIELPKSKIYDQTGSCRCWVHAGINMIKHNIASNLNIEEKDIDLSINYIIFFDKLEKSNNAYENIIRLDNIDYDFINKENILKYCVAEGGWFEWFVAIVNKYGIVPSTEMPETFNSKDSDILTSLFTEKIKKDSFKIITMKKNNESIEDIQKEKSKMLEANYNLLCKVLGEPPVSFEFEYRNKNNEYIKTDTITPKEFKNKFLSIDLNNYVAVCNVPMYNKPYYKKFRKKYLSNIVNNSYVEFINVPIETLKQLTIQQLKDNMPVWFATEIRKMRNKELGILDSNLYKYREVLGIEMLTKEESLNFFDIDLEHAMVFTGVNLNNDNVPERWKVEDSYGPNIEKDGYYIMNDNYFDDFVMEVIIDRKYLSKELLEIYNQEPIIYDVEDPM